MKYILLGLLIFILYRMITKPKPLDLNEMDKPLQEPDNDEYVDYDEVE
jgi:hypothetical protein